MMLALSCGWLYAAVLWFAASRVALARMLTLGGWPGWTLVGCGFASAAIVQTFPPGDALLVGASLIGAIVCATIDLRTGLIFDVVSATSALVAAALATVTGHLWDGVRAALIVGGALYALHRGTGRRGLGLGDVKLGAALALGFGLERSIVAVGSAFIIGALYAVVLLARGRAQRTDELRFGPCIAGGAATSLVAGVLGYRL